MKIRIATRKSPLALWQTRHVQTLLQKIDARIDVELVKIVTEGDRFLKQPLATIGGKGLFVTALEGAIQNNEADLAVHSMKDLPAYLPDGLTIACMLERDDPRDLLINPDRLPLHELPKQAVIGTSSLRRQAQLKALRPDLQIKMLRGNVGTRLNKLYAGNYDAIILAAIGVQRLGHPISLGHCFSMDDMLPAAGQGVIAVECRSDDSALLKLLRHLDHKPTRQCVLAERAVNNYFGGGCHLPIAAYACLEVGQILHLRAMVASDDGQSIVRNQASGHSSKAGSIGLSLAEQLVASDDIADPALK